MAVAPLETQYIRQSTCGVLVLSICKLNEHYFLFISDKIQDVLLDGDFILSKEETKLWKSRRKEKLFKYKGNKKSKVLTEVV